MSSRLDRAQHALTALVAWGLFGSFGALDVVAASLTLRDGTVIRGTVEQEGSFVRVDDGLRRVTFGTKRLSHVDPTAPLTSFKPFRIPQNLAGRSQTERIDNLLTIEKITPFDESGRRTFSVRDARGVIDIVQGITEINPEYIKVQALKYPWESSIATHALPQETVEAILRRNIDSGRVDDRLRLARFFLATEWFLQAGKELHAIEQEFPEVAEQVHEATTILEQLKSRQRLKEIKLRRDAGQHSFAYQFLKDFVADGAPGDVLTEVRDLVKRYDTMLERADQARAALDRLIGQVGDAELQARLSAPLHEISESLHVENLSRLDNFLSAAAREELAAEERLALAVSGWVAGSAFAEPKIDRALRLWDGRDKIIEYLREESSNRRGRLVSELRAQEILSVDLAAHVIEHLVPVVPADNLEAGKPARITVGLGRGSIEYWVLLPPEYNPYRRYPVIVTLHGQAMSPETQLAWWSSPPGFQASRRGYIVVAPRYVDDPSQGYHYDAAAHDAVLYTLIDLRRRFSVDSDRVFLTGHSMGGHAAWDIGLAHPDLFAGVIPICGSPQFYCEQYWPNGEHAAFYVVEGEKDGKGPEQNHLVLDRMMAKGHDAVYVEYKGRGHENFSDEILRLFDWMSRKTRQKFPLSFSCLSARPTDNEFYWVSVDEFVPEVTMDPRLFDRKKIRTAKVEGKITGTANSIQVVVQGAKQAELWLSPGMVDLNQPVGIHVNGKLKNRKMVALDLEVLLEDFRVRADRQKMFYAKMSVPRL